MKKFLQLTLLSEIINLLSISQIQAQLKLREVDALMENALARFQVAGASVAIVKDGKVISLQRIQMKGIFPDIDFSFDFHYPDLQRVDR